jgi:hypothetical protein
MLLPSLHVLLPQPPPNASAATFNRYQKPPPNATVLPPSSNATATATATAATAAAAAAIFQRSIHADCCVLIFFF